MEPKVRMQRRWHKGWNFTGTEELRLNSLDVQVWLWPEAKPLPYQMWRLIPVSEMPGSGSPPSYDGNAAGQSSTRTQHFESEQDEFGTIVNEVTVVTTNSTVTTRKKYRV